MSLAISRQPHQTYLIIKGNVEAEIEFAKMDFDVVRQIRRDAKAEVEEMQRLERKALRIIR